MALKVIGAGFGRTGTMSLKLALERLGYQRCYHMFEVFSEHREHIPTWAAAHRGEAIDWDDLFSGYLAAVDWPTCNLWRELAGYYPLSKVILTLRDPESWHASVLRTIHPRSMARLQSDDPQLRMAGEWLNEIIWQGVFHGRIEDRSYAMGIYNAHVESVRTSISQDRLLVLEGPQSWESLCTFLHCPIPDEEYPHRNTTQEFLARVQESNQEE